MESDEWYGLIAPQCKTKEDWVFGLIAVVNALGWGYWSVSDFQPKEYISLSVSGSYESNSYTAMYGQSKVPRSYLVTGGTAALMNLLYHGNITEKPTLNEDYYKQLFTTNGSYLAKQVKCRSMGDDHCMAKTYLFKN